MEASTPSRRIHFGKFEVDRESGELFKDRHPIRLQGQPIQILLMLLEKPGRIVTREELQQRLWPGDTFVDFDHSLNAAIQRLREGLNDSADIPRYIETLPRRGYRFIHPIEAPQEEAKEESGPGEEEASGVPAIYFHTFATHGLNRLFTMPKGLSFYRFAGNLAVSPDERSILIAALERVESDLWLVENFR